MIDQFNIQLERERIILCDDDVDVWRDLQNYNIVRYTDKGAPVFTNKNEHTVDALLLAMVAFIIEMPELSGTMNPMNIARHMKKTKINMEDPLKDFNKENFNKINEKAGLRRVPLGHKSQKSRNKGFSRGSSSSDSNGNEFSRKGW